MAGEVAGPPAAELVLAARVAHLPGSGVGADLLRASPAGCCCLVCPALFCVRSPSSSAGVCEPSVGGLVAAPGGIKCPAEACGRLGGGLI